VQSFGEVLEQSVEQSLAADRHAEQVRHSHNSLHRRFGTGNPVYELFPARNQPARACFRMNNPTSAYLPPDSERLDR
jgi:hypothetical protein